MNSLVLLMILTICGNPAEIVLFDSDKLVVTRYPVGDEKRDLIARELMHESPHLIMKAEEVFNFQCT